MRYLLQNKIILGFVLFLILTSMVACRQVSSNDIAAWDKLQLQEGDIVFRRGSSLASQIVLASDTRGNYSHIGILVLDRGHFKVVHAVPGESEPKQPDRVKMEAIQDYFAANKAVAGEVMRLQIDDSLRVKVAASAKDCFSKKILFDHDYDLSEQSCLYCTELIWYVFNAIDIDITHESRSYVNFLSFKGDFIFPSDISKNEELISIYSFNNH